MADSYTIPAGRLRHRVILQRPDPESPKSAKGQRQTEYIDVATVSAAIEPLSGREAFIAAQQQASTSHMITIRWSSNLSRIDGSWRVVFGDRIFVLDGLPRIVGECRSIIVMPCVEGPRKK